MSIIQALKYIAKVNTDVCLASDNGLSSQSQVTRISKRNRNEANGGQESRNAKIAGPISYLLVREGVCSKVPHLASVEESSIMKR